MITKMKLKTYLLLIPIFLVGCTVQQKSLRQQPETIKDLNYFSQVQSIGNKGYYAELQYDALEGSFKIIFLNREKYRIKLVKENKIKGLIRQAKGFSHEFFFYNPMEFGRHFYSSPSEREPHAYEPVDVLYASKKKLKNLSSFILKIWIPVEESTYRVEYTFTRPEET